MKSKTKSYIYFFVFIFFASTSLSSALIKEQVPCYVKITAGNELRVPIDTDRKAELIIKNAGENESEFVVMEYRNGKPRKDYKAESTSFNKSNYHKDWKFNRYFDQTPASLLVDEVRIEVKKGTVYAEFGQSGEDRIDFYNNGYQRGTSLNPKKPLIVQITGESNQTSGSFWMEYEGGTRSDKISFSINKGKTQTWNYSADKKITDFEVDVTKGHARISLFQSSRSKNKSR